MTAANLYKDRGIHFTAFHLLLMFQLMANADPHQLKMMIDCLGIML